jgi:hypothetical protein
MSIYFVVRVYILFAWAVGLVYREKEIALTANVSFSFLYIVGLHALHV